MTCQRCGAAYFVERHRGGTSGYCPACQRDHRLMANRIRQQRHAVASLFEIIETVAPRIDSWKREVTEAQAGACFRCNQRRRLYLAPHERAVVGLCLTCFETWRSRK